MRPGVQVQILDSPPPRSIPTDTGTWFAVGECDSGPSNQAIFVQSLGDFVRLCGNRTSYSVLYDAIDTFFHEGGNAAWIGRVVGPAASAATHNLLDGSAGTSLIVSAIGPGASGDNIKVAVLAGVSAGFRIAVYDSANTLLEQSGDLLNQQAAMAWAAKSSYIRIAVGGSSLNPAVAASVALSGGDDDRANITDAQWLAALTLFSKDLGPGNVSAPGRTTDVGHQQLLAHAAANNRYGLLDYPDTYTKATLETSATNAKSTGNGQYGFGFAPWLEVPGVVAGTTRPVPPCALVAGRCASVDPIDGPGTPAAGAARGVANYANDVSQAGWDDATRDELNTSGINVIRVMNGQVTVYGWRSLADPITNPDWVDAGTGRYLMGLGARCYARGQQFVFDKIDGQGHTIAAYQGALVSLCQDDWNLEEIFGQTAAEAFHVETGPTVNTPTTLGNNELRAAVAVRPSPMAELVTIQIVNVPITEAVA